MVGQDPQNPADPRKVPGTGQSGGIPDPYEGLRRLFTCPECAFDLSRVAWAIIIPQAAGAVTALVKPLRCPECGAWQIGPRLAVVPARGGVPS